jgi:hypothetical protein
MQQKKKTPTEKNFRVQAIRRATKYKPIMISSSVLHLLVIDLHCQHHMWEFFPFAMRLFESTSLSRLSRSRGRRRRSTFMVKTIFTVVKF